MFLLAILGTMILYSLAVILVPHNYENIVDWKAYYYKNSRFYLLLQIVSGIQILALNELGGSQMTRYIWIVAGITWIFFVSAAFNQNEKLHYFVAYVVGLGFALGSILGILFTTDMNLVN